MSMDWRRLLQDTGRRLQRRAVDRAAEAGRNAARRVFGQESYIPEELRRRLERRAAQERRRGLTPNRSRRRVMSDQARPSRRRVRVSRRTPGGTPAQRAWRKRFAELSRAGQLPRRGSRRQ